MCVCVCMSMDTGTVWRGTKSRSGAGQKHDSVVCKVADQGPQQMKRENPGPEAVEMVTVATEGCT